MEGYDRFEIGKTYENRLGLYEVTAIEPGKDLLRVRYEKSGEEEVLRLSAQERILRNMDWDALEKKRTVAQERERLQPGYGVDFTGLRAADFSLDTTGTTWRSRRGLAGKVAHQLAAGAGYAFVSWAIYGWPVAFLTHHEDYRMAAYELGVRKAKFTLEVDEQCIYYGLYVERDAGPMGHTWDWPRLMSALYPGSPLAAQLASAEEALQLHCIGRAFAGRETTHFHFSNGLGAGARSLWPEENPRSTPLSSRLERLAAVPEDQWVELYILGQMGRNAAVAAGVRLSTLIADVMQALLPLYEVASGRRLP